jgi:hypothetical protein
VSDASGFLRAHPALRRAMEASSAFRDIKRQAALDVDEERLYIVRGDTLGSAEDLFVEAVVRGAQQVDPDDRYRAVYLELDDQVRALIDQRVRGESETSTHTGNESVEGEANADG